MAAEVSYPKIILGSLSVPRDDFNFWNAISCMPGCMLPEVFI